MKAVIISDIHGNFYYMKKLDDYLNNNPIDKLIILGDLGNEEQVINILNKYKDIIIAVRGNCDRNNNLLFDNSGDIKKISLDYKEVFITHGHLIPYFYNVIKDNIVFCGHTHIYNLDGQYINPGSIGEPRKNDEHTFLMYQNGILSLINLDNYEVIESRKL